MSFLYPTFLWALFAISIPIIIHLFSFRQRKTIYFSNTIFLESIRNENRSRSRLKQILILISRILIVSSLIFAFAGPILIPQNVEDTLVDDKVVAIYVDNSYSMQNQSELGNMLNVAKQKAIDITEVYGENVHYLLLTNSMLPEYYRNLSYTDIRSYISQIELSNSQKPISDIFITAQSIINNQHFSDSHNSMYIISDFQKSTLALDRFVDNSNIEVSMVSIRPNNIHNISIDSIWFDSPFRVPNRDEQLYVKIINHSNDNVEDVPVQLFINDSMRAVNSVSFGPFESTVINFQYKNPTASNLHAKLSVADLPVTFDNDFYFNYKMNINRNVLIINGEEASSFPSSVYGDENLMNIVQTQSDKVNLSTLLNYNVIILNGLSYLTDGLIGKIDNFLESKGVLWLIPNQNADINSYNKFLSRINGPILSEWNKNSIPVADIAWESNFFKGVFVDKDKNIDFPNIIGAWNLQKRTSATSETLIKSSSHLSLFEYISVNQSSVYVSASPYHKDYGNFVSHPLFIPIAYNVVLNLPNTNSLSFFGGNDNVLSIKTELSREDKIVITNGEFELIPSWTNFGKWIKVFIPKEINNSGFYDVLINDEKVESFSMNYQSNESDLDFYSIDQIKSLLETNGITNANIYNGDNLDISSDISETEQGKKLWFFFIISALIFVIIEVLIIRFLRS